MTTRNPTPTEHETNQALVGPSVDEDDLIQTVEVPFRNMPDGVLQVNAVISHPDSGRSVRRIVVRDEPDEAVRDTEIGLVGDREVYEIDRGWIEWSDSTGSVYVPVLDESMPADEYAELVGFDRPTWKISGGFDESMRQANGNAPW